MSNPIALPSPEARAISAGADGAAGRARRARSRPRPWPPPSAVATPPEDCITSGCGRPASLGRLAEPAQVAAEQRREVGVDRRRRAALVLAEARQDLVRGGDVDAREARRAGARRGARSCVGVEVGEEQADRDRLGAAVADQRSASRSRLAVAERLDDPLRPDPLGGLEAQLALDQRRRLRRAEAVEVGAVLAGDLEQVGEAAGRDQRRAGAAFLEQGVGADRHPVGEGLDRAGARRRRASTSSTARSRRSTGPPAWSAASRCGSARRRRGRRR